MKIGLDTTFLVQAEIAEHERNAAARQMLVASIERGHRFVICPQVVSELLHVVSDPQRFARPLSMDVAVLRVRRIFASNESDFAVFDALQVICP